MQANSAVKPLLILIGIASIAMLAGALVLQHVFGWEPCTLCIQIRLWLLCASVASVLILLTEQLGVRWLSVLFWPILLAASGMAVYDNAHLLLIETGILPSTSCSPFPFYAFYLPLHEWMPDVFMSAGVCGENDYKILGLSFSAWTFLSVATLFAFVLYTLVRAIRR
jgi:disulfide bond formation protein DsbB